MGTNLARRCIHRKFIAFQLIDLPLVFPRGYTNISCLRDVYAERFTIGLYTNKTSLG